MFSQAKLLIGGALILIIGSSVWAGYVYVTNLQEKVTFQATEITKFELANESLTTELTKITTNLKINEENQIILNEELRIAREDKASLIKLFADHDFAKLVNRKPGLIERRINKGTDKIFKEFEDISDE